MTRAVAAEDLLPQPGEELDRKYRIVGIVGEGGMGVVFQAEHIRLGKRVAIKMLRPVARQPEFVVRFAREARAAGQLRSAHAVRVMDVGETEEGLPYMVMEFLDGHDLARELEIRRRLPHNEAVDYVIEATEAMIEAHGCGIIHRDLKPSNLFLATEGEKRVVKVCDFGISKMESAIDALVTATQSSIGTPLYMSPEQVRCSKRVDERTDVWSLGVILYELIAGRAPFEGGSAASLGAAIVTDPPVPFDASLGVPEALENAIAVALSKDPNGRFPTMRAFGEALVPFSSSGHALPSDRTLMGSQIPPATPSIPVFAKTLGHAPTVVAVSGARGTTVRTAPGGRRAALMAALVVVPVVLAGIAVVAVRSRPKGVPPVDPSQHAAATASAPADLAQPDPPIPSLAPLAAETAASPSPSATASSVSAPAPVRARPLVRTPVAVPLATATASAAPVAKNRPARL